MQQILGVDARSTLKSACVNITEIIRCPEFAENRQFTPEWNPSCAFEEDRRVREHGDNDGGETKIYTKLNIENIYEMIGNIPRRNIF